MADRILGGHGAGELWQGSWADAMADGHRFDVVVFCAQERQPDPTWERAHRGEVIRFPTDDAELTRDHLAQAILLAQRLERRVRQRKRVLVTCNMGLNRSGLVTALTAHRLTAVCGRGIVSHIQRKRFGALCNPSFARALGRLPGIELYG